VLPVHNETKRICLDSNNIDAHKVSDNFNKILNDMNSIIVPFNWSRILPANKKMVIFSKVFVNKDVELPYFERCVSVHEDMTIECRYLNKIINNYSILNQSNMRELNNIQNLIYNFDLANMCSGVKIPEEDRKYLTKTTYKDTSDSFRHINCSLILNTTVSNPIDLKAINKNKKPENCKFCKKILNLIKEKKSRSPRLKRIHIQVTPSKKLKLKALRNRNKLNTESKKRIQNKLSKILIEFKELKIKFRSLEHDTIVEKLIKNNTPPNHLLLIKEIFAAAEKKGPKGNRYTEDWIMLCMLLHIRSPSGYSFMRENKLLPLPCIRSIRNYLQLIKTSCGFDEQFLQLFAKHLEGKEEYQKHGLLIFDEISLRQSISVNTKTLTYSGLIDFGSEDLPKANDLSDKATHGLVFMFQPLADSYTQPIAVFASKGPVAGLTLTQLIIKAVVLLENAGAKVHGLVSDGAQTNRKAWKELGIRGHLNDCQSHVEHFVDSSRKFFVFSDTPHLIKNVRNRLYNNKELLVILNFKCLKILLNIFITSYFL